MSSAVLIIESGSILGEFKQALCRRFRRRTPIGHRLVEVGLGEHNMRLGIFRVQLQAALQNGPRLKHVLLRPLRQTMLAPQEQVVGREVCRAFTQRAAAVGLLDAPRNAGNNALRDFVLHGEDILELPIELLCPEMIPCCRLHELHRYAQVRPGFPYAPFDDKSYTKLACYLAHIYQLVPILEWEVARDDKELAKP